MGVRTTVGVKVVAGPSGSDAPAVPTGVAVAPEKATGRESPYRLRAVELTKAFGGVTVLDHVNLGFSRGEVHAVIGENGAGKSTLLSFFPERMLRTPGA